MALKIQLKKICFDNGTKLKTSYQYGVNDRIVGYKTKDNSGKIVQESSYDYYPNGILKQSTIVDKASQRVFVSIYDETGKKLSSSTNRGRNIEVSKYHYDKNNAMRHEELFDEYGRKFLDIIPEYDEKGRMTSISSYDYNKELVYKKFIDPKTGQELKIVYRAEDGTIVSEEFFCDAEDNKKTFFLMKEGDKETFITKYKYDDQKRLLSETTYLEGQKTDVINYNKRNGKVASKIQFATNGMPIIEDYYLYDKYDRDAMRIFKTCAKEFPRMQIFDYENGRFIEYNCGK